MTNTVPTMDQLREALKLPLEIPQYEPKNNNNLRHQAMMRWMMKTSEGEVIECRRGAHRSKWDREG